MQTFKTGEVSEAQQKGSAISYRNTNSASPKLKRSGTASALKVIGQNIKQSSISFGMNKTFKELVDKYFTDKYTQLESTTTKIIKKHNRTLDATNILSHTYLYILEKEPEILHFSRTFAKSIEHTIYSFTIKHINSSIVWTNSQINLEEMKIKDRCVNLEDNIQTIDYQNNARYQHNIYNEAFIDDFQKTLSKEDAIYFQAYYYDGFETDKELAKKYNISKSSAYLMIVKLKKQMKTHIQKHKIE